MLFFLLTPALNACIIRGIFRLVLFLWHLQFKRIISVLQIQIQILTALCDIVQYHRLRRVGARRRPLARRATRW